MTTNADAGFFQTVDMYAEIRKEERERCIIEIQEMMGRVNRLEPTNYFVELGYKAALQDTIDAIKKLV